ncbi:hypothetical protein PWT90_09654 [Aphanocladium album]|nr:hypothetical protein PWT90_09654 [Aphanocladium album]
MHPCAPLVAAACPSKGSGSVTCDERQPKCSRCLKQGVNCEYVSAADGDEGQPSLVFDRHGAQASPESDSEMKDAGSAPTFSPQSSTSSHINVRSHAPEHSGMPPFAGRGRSKRLRQLPTLDARELELFSHYITHDSHRLAYGKEDLYPLKVGMPNLAFSNPAVMDSILALAASCKCFDMLGEAVALTDIFDEICDLLRLADRHHQSALGQLPEDLSDRQFQSVLPNGALMVLYVLSCHYVRILLYRSAKRLGISLPNDVLPFQSQWITSIRAAHVAFVGLLAPTLRSPSEVASPASNSREEMESQSSPPGPPDDDQGAYLLEDGPAEETRRLLLPVVSTTYEAALVKLRARNANLGPNGDAIYDPKLEACSTALRLLEELFQAVMGDEPVKLGPTQSRDFGVLDNVPPWLVKYLARVTSAAPSKLWRRRIMAFLNRVPFEYMHLVQLALDCMTIDDRQALSQGATEPVQLEAAQKPAMDIFAHWLVLVMLLDGVWWIGDAGHWELGRIIRLIESQALAIDLAPGETWWPETMYSVKSTLSGTT